LRRPLLDKLTDSEDEQMPTIEQTPLVPEVSSSLPRMPRRRLMPSRSSRSTALRWKPCRRVTSR